MSGKVSTTFAAVFYGLAVLAAWFFGVFLADLDLLEWHNRHATSVEFDAMLGVGVGLVVVVLSAVLERSAEWARRLSEAFADILGPLSMGIFPVIYQYLCRP